MKIKEIKRSDFKKKAIQERWTVNDVKIIDEILKTWLDSSIACSVLTCFNDNDDLHAYMPIIYDNVVPSVQVKDLLSASGNLKIIGIEPYPISQMITKQEGEEICYILRQHYWQGEEVFILSDNEQVLEIKTKPVSLETIKHARDKIQLYKLKTGKTHTTLVRAVEAMQREYDEISGFAKLKHRPKLYFALK